LDLDTLMEIRSAYNLVLHKKGSLLYDTVKSLIASHLNTVSQSHLIPNLPQRHVNARLSGQDVFLNKFCRVWDEHTTSMLMIRDILMYLDRMYVSTANELKIYDLGLVLFRDGIVEPLSNSLYESLLHQIQLERQGESIDRSNMKMIIHMLNSIQDSNLKVFNGIENTSQTTLYDTQFEVQFLDASRLFYRDESLVLAEELVPNDYLIKVI
jgi:cullin 3